MTTALDLSLLVVTLLLAFGAPVLLSIWIRAAADWCWLLALRKRVVGAVSFAVLLTVTGLLRLIFGLHFMSPLAVLIGLFATPLCAIPIANLLARYRLPSAHRLKSASLRDFIFVQRRQEQSEAYSAPSAEV